MAAFDTPYRYVQCLVLTYDYFNGAWEFGIWRRDLGGFGTCQLRDAGNCKCRNYLTDSRIVT